ncbi:hypothetical protein SDRG_02795 [Saprolegnia diclina VS20]|uniref:C2HC/C3H-type domain-containing protein n=1 Tax=Saprolegnia diclina (strain VS20) TaxID=1156394 RepID=T0R1F0_SAPDV|nr:hypothetical protein SDRG_02795 [Saprolegnia diclina VS20]EQC40145.1 hypothetical protein SDRG_02795 [Saprolegnia diclina VS20]|eukprot:XP_008606619.1 hypothetical protein SDRG_02795 [Saprolegnia diclina VS20]
MSRLHVQPLLPTKDKSFYDKIAAYPTRFPGRRKAVSEPPKMDAARRPKVRLCYVCGREYGLSSFEIHLKQCKLLWIAQEEKKPLRERRPVPEPPQELPIEANVLYQLSPDELEAQNRAAARAFEEKVMEKCAYCGRTFNPERLAIHNRSCTAERPARAVGTARLSPSPSLSADSSPPPTTSTTEPSPQRTKRTGSPSYTESTASSRSSMSSYADSTASSRSSMSSTLGRLSLTSSQGRPSSQGGRLSTSSSQGGGGSRPTTPPQQLRGSTPPQTRPSSRGATPPGADRSRPSTRIELPALSASPRPTTKTPASAAQLAEFQAKLDFWEGQALAMVRDIRAMKELLAQMA